MDSLFKSSLNALSDSRRALQRLHEFLDVGANLFVSFFVSRKFFVIVALLHFLVCQGHAAKPVFVGNADTKFSQSSFKDPFVFRINGRRFSGNIFSNVLGRRLAVAGKLKPCGRVRARISENSKVVGFLTGRLKAGRLVGTGGFEVPNSGNASFKFRSRTTAKDDSTDTPSGSNGLDASGATGLSIASGKTLTAFNSIALAGADGVQLTLGGNFTVAGAGSITLIPTGETNLSLPSSGTVATLAGNEPFMNKTYNGAVIWTNTQSTGPSIAVVTGGTPVITGDANVALGYQAGIANTGGRESVYIGYQAGHLYTDSGDGVESGLNTFVGSTAGWKTSGFGIANVFVGQKAGINNTTGLNNTFLGAHSGASFGTGANNVVVGRGAADNGSYITAAGGQNVLVGNFAMGGMSGTCNGNTMIGYNAGVGVTTADENVFIGSTSGATNTTGIHNVLVGTRAGGSKGATNSNNIFIGYEAGMKCTASNGIVIGNATIDGYGGGVVIGYLAGNALTNGVNNVFVGPLAGQNITTGINNVFIGQGAGAAAATNNSSNTCVGYNAGATATFGSENICIGQSSGGGMTTGGANTFLGTNTGAGSASVTNSIVIGHGATSSGDNQVTLGPDTITQTLLKGAVILKQSAPPASSSASGVAGTIAWDDSYIYVCTATNTWKRIALSTW